MAGLEEDAIAADLESDVIVRILTTTVAKVDYILILVETLMNVRVRTSKVLRQRAYIVDGQTWISSA